MLAFELACYYKVYSQRFVCSDVKIHNLSQNHVKCPRKNSVALKESLQFFFLDVVDLLVILCPVCLDCCHSHVSKSLCQPREWFGPTTVHWSDCGT